MPASLDPDVLGPSPTASAGLPKAMS